MSRFAILFRYIRSRYGVRLPVLIVIGIGLFGSVAMFRWREGGVAWIDGLPEHLAVPHARLIISRGRDVPSGELPLLGKGWSVVEPLQIPSESLRVSSADDLARAMMTAQAGEVIEIAPGNYRLQTALVTGNPGTETKSITVLARLPGTVNLDVRVEEGIRVTQPYWHFENLALHGACADDTVCEHGIHVVGAAHHTIIRNNFIQDFNAQIKVNGLHGKWPDDGQIMGNSLTNSRPRATSLPVTPVDLVGADRWVVADNLIRNFVKAGGDGISYGVFMKGGSHEGKVERNLVICSDRDIAASGARVGISFGGGGTGQRYCRNGDCRFEHSEGIISHNVVAHCNDVGVDIRRSDRVMVAFNTLINTRGIDARDAAIGIRVYGNLLDAGITVRDGSEVEATRNVLVNLSRVQISPDLLDLRWRRVPEPVPEINGLGEDFCHQKRQESTVPGAVVAISACP